MRSCRWCSCQYQVEAACRLLCCDEFALQPKGFCSTACRLCWMCSTAQVCMHSVEHRLLEVQWPLGQNHYSASLEPHRLYCSQTYYKLRIILGSCSANRTFTDRLGYYVCHSTNQRSTGQHGAHQQVPLQWLLMLTYGLLKPQM